MHRRLHGNRHPQTAWALYELADSLRAQGKLQEAESALRESLDISRRVYGHDHRFVGWLIDHLKSLLDERGDQAALDALAREEANRPVRSDTHNEHLRLAGLLLANNPSGAQKAAAHRLLRQAIDKFAQVAVDAPDNLASRLIATEGYVEVARICTATPDFDNELDEAHRRLMTELKELLVKSPNSSECQWRTAIMYRGWVLAVLPDSAYLSTTEHALREAIKLYETVSLSDPKLPGVWLVLANSYAYLGDVQRRSARPEDAVAAFRRAMQIYDEQGADLTVHPNSDAIIDHARIACYLATIGQEVKAKVVLDKATIYAQRMPASSASANAHYLLAVAQARLGDMAGYRATCKTLVHLPLVDTDDLTKSPAIWSPSLTPDAFDRPIWTTSLAPDALDDLSLHVKRVEEFAANNPLIQSHFRLSLLGAALYRAGHYDRAADELEKSIAVYPSGPPRGTDTINYHRLFLAMTKWQLGQKHEARQLLAETQPAVDEELQSPSSSWNRRATLEVLRGEAETLIGPKEADEGQNNDNSTPTTPATTDNGLRTMDN